MMSSSASAILCISATYHFVEDGKGDFCKKNNHEAEVKERVSERVVCEVNFPYLGRKTVKVQAS